MKDLKFTIHTANTCSANVWKPTTVSWPDMEKKLTTTKRTKETMSEYAKMSNDKKKDIKNVGAFVAGELKNDSRKKDNVINRCMLTLDADNNAEGLPTKWADFIKEYAGLLYKTFKDNNNRVESNPLAFVIYPTHSDRPDNRRFRVVVPLSRPVIPPEYEVISRYVVNAVGTQYFDSTTHEPNRCFFWPSTPKDGIFDPITGGNSPLNVESVLSVAPMIEQRKLIEESINGIVPDTGIKNRIGRAQNPREKNGAVGLFCRAYSIEDAIETFLSDVYKYADNGRYTYISGTTHGGLVCYDGLWAYSHHDSDPIGGKLVNAFDIVRLHKFSNMDARAKAETPVNRLPSYTEMVKLAENDNRVKAEKLKQANEDFAGYLDGDGLELLTYDTKGRIENTRANLETILLNDKTLSAIKYDLFLGADVITEVNHLSKTRGVELDDNMLTRATSLIEKRYGLKKSVNAVQEALQATTPERSFHSVKELIASVEWDGVKRIDTLLIEYLGAVDTPINRAFMRKWMIGAVARATTTDGNPINFQNVLLLIGDGGTGKSQFIWTLAYSGGYHSNSVNFSIRDKELIERTHGAFIVELAELSGLSRAEYQDTKDMISTNTDRVRRAYAHKTSVITRKYAFIATTNNETPLRDPSMDNRRWWCVVVKGYTRDWRNELAALVPQLWAEAYQAYKAGESFELDADQKEEVTRMNLEHSNTQDDPILDVVKEYLEKSYPANYLDMTKEERSNNAKDYMHMGDGKGHYLNEVSVKMFNVDTNSSVKPKTFANYMKVLGWRVGRTKNMPDDCLDKDGYTKRAYIRPVTKLPALMRGVALIDIEADESLL